MLKLKYYREKLGLSQAELSKKICISQQSISAYEKGTREPDINTINIICDFFNITSDELLGRTDIHNELHQAASSDIDLAKLAEMDPNKKKMIEKTTNEMIDMFYKEFGKKK